MVRRASVIPDLFDTRRVQSGRWDGVAFIDPGLGGTGVAYWPKIGRGDGWVVRPSEYWMVMKPKASLHWTARVDSIAGAVYEYFDDHYLPKTVVIEFPGLWSDSPRSVASAQRGDLFKLTYLVGYLGGVLNAVAGADIVLVTPLQWKGQLSKRVVDRRIKRAIDKEYPDHASDAHGMGLAVQGAL